jgi:hypothetical protein
MLLVDRVMMLTAETPDLAARLQAEGLTRVVIGGRPMEAVVEPIATDAIQLGMDVLVLTDLSADEPSADGGVLRGVLRLRKIGAALTNAGQVTTILVTHKIPTVLVLVNIDPANRTSFKNPETFADLEALLAHAKK